MGPMRDYPESRTYLLAHIRRSAQRDAKALHDIGMEASPDLKCMMFERALTEAERDYRGEVRATMRHNIRHLKRASRARQRTTHIRNGLVTLVCEVMLVGACFYQGIHGNYGMGILYAVGALVFGMIYAVSVLF